MNKLRNLKTDAYIDGKFVPSISRERFVTINPANGEKLATIAACNVEDVDIAVKSARKAFEDGRWINLTPKERNEILSMFCHYLYRPMSSLLRGSILVWIKVHGKTPSIEKQKMILLRGYW